MNCRGCANFDPEAPWLMQCDERVTVKNEHGLHFRAADRLFQLFIGFRQKMGIPGGDGAAASVADSSKGGPALGSAGVTPLILPPVWAISSNSVLASLLFLLMATVPAVGLRPPHGHAAASSFRAGRTRSPTTAKASGMCEY